MKNKIKEKVLKEVKDYYKEKHDVDLDFEFEEGGIGTGAKEYVEVIIDKTLAEVGKVIGIVKHTKYKDEIDMFDDLEQKLGIEVLK